MGAVEKVAISVDRDLIRRAEKLRKATGESRSALVSRALAQLLASEEGQDLIAQYIDAYRTKPENAADTALATTLARRSLRTLAWEDE